MNNEVLPRASSEQQLDCYMNKKWLQCSQFSRCFVKSPAAFSDRNHARVTAQ